MKKAKKEKEKKDKKERKYRDLPFLWEIHFLSYFYSFGFNPISSLACSLSPSLAPTTYTHNAKNAVQIKQTIYIFLV